MHSAKPNRKPVFAWQAILIVLPVIALAAVGIFFLRQDKRLALSEAAERAQIVADQLAPLVWGELTNTNGTSWSIESFIVDAEGQLVFPRQYEPLPKPQPLDTETLDEHQGALWKHIQEQEQRLAQTRTDPEGASNNETSEISRVISAYREFIDKDPPGRFAAVAQYRLAMLLRTRGEFDDATALFRSLSVASTEAVGESGMPLAPLAEWHWLKMIATNETARSSDPAENPGDAETRSSSVPAPNLGAKVRIQVEALCSNLVHQPGPLTGYVLRALRDDPLFADETNKVSKWQSIWEDHEDRRQLWVAASSLLKPSALQLYSTTAPMDRHEQALGSGMPDSTKPSTFWFTNVTDWSGSLISHPAVRTSGGGWVGIAVPNSADQWLVSCLRDTEAGILVRNIVERTRTIPEYLGVGVELAGLPLKPQPHVWREVNYMTRSGGGLRQEYTPDLATKVSGTAGVPGVDLGMFRVNVYLTSPSYLMRRQTARTFWVGTLIGFSALGAFIGLLAGYRAFQRQLRLSELKSNFVSSVSHELRAPIASIRLMAESLDRGKVNEPPKQKEYFAFIVRECRRLSGLIENVLDFSRIDQGRKRYEFEETDVRALVAQTVKLMEPTAREREVELVCANPPPAGSPADDCLTLDGRAIQQALINLIDNAIKHSPKSQAVTIGWERNESALSLWVEDQGPGIPREEHEKIFERFYRRGSELRRETQGVGIGLSIVKHIIEAHDGKILVRSAPGQGSRFTLQLPSARSGEASGSA